uniref:Predicted protein n=1 Tax=Hordeum vulgare subsp. vulgare TaxID=112509 RepID=F2ECJ2_HORVV|nr:predicted protein [Hordeum vulgare subsp. vulgare]BAK07175.1 predicted protein [Hordeum vulgare subsp. vulgare]
MCVSLSTDRDEFGWALYHESTAGAARWRPVCRMEPRLTSQEKIVWRSIFFLFQATISGHTCSKSNNH